MTIVFQPVSLSRIMLAAVDPKIYDTIINEALKNSGFLLKSSKENLLKPDMYGELKKLKALLDSGILTQADFDQQKSKIPS